jgi:hypothetical protein
VEGTVGNGRRLPTRVEVNVAGSWTSSLEPDTRVSNRGRPQYDLGCGRRQGDDFADQEASVSVGVSSENNAGFADCGVASRRGIQ